MSRPRPARDGSGVVRLLAWRLAGAAAIAAAVAVAGRNEGPSEGDVRVLPYPAGPLVEDLARCRSLEAAVDDPACKSAWARQRERFLAPNPVREGGQVAPGSKAEHGAPAERPSEPAKDQDRLTPETPAGTGGL